MTPASREAMMGVFCPWALLNFQDSQPRMRKWRLREMKPEPKGTLTCGDGLEPCLPESKSRCFFTPRSAARCITIL